MEVSEEESTSFSGHVHVGAPKIPLEPLQCTGDIPGERYGHSSIRVGQRMYVFGGCDVTGKFLDELYVLDLYRGVWKFLGSSVVSAGEGVVWPKGRHFHGVAMVDDRFIYVLFGKSNGYLNDVHRYNLTSQLWERVEPVPGQPFPSKRYGHSVVTYGGDLYVYGGFDDLGLRCNDLWHFVPKTNQWNLISNLQSIESPEAMHHSAVVFEGSMYIWGGQECSNDLYEYRFGSKSWSKMQHPRSVVAPRPRWGHKAVIWDKDMYILGGCDALLSHNAIWRFNFTECMWHFEGEAENWSARNFFSLTYDENGLILFGGRNNYTYLFNDVVRMRLHDVRRDAQMTSSTFKKDMHLLLLAANAADDSVFDEACMIRFSLKGGAKSVAHKSILFVRVPALRKSKSDSDFVSFSKPVFDKFLSFVYCGDLFRQEEEDSDMALLQALFILAKMVEFRALIVYLETTLGALINVENVTELLSFVISVRKTYSFKAPKLAQAVVRFAVANFSTLKQRLKSFPTYYPDIKYLAQKEIKDLK